MKKVILTAIFVSNFALCMQQGTKGPNWENVKKTYVGLKKSDKNKQLYSNQLTPGVPALLLYQKKLDLTEDINVQQQDPNSMWYCLGKSAGRFSRPMYVLDSIKLVNTERVHNNSCDISSFVNSFGDESVHCIIDDNNVHKTCSSPLIASNALAINFLYACEQGKHNLIRGILSYIDQKQAPTVIKEAMAILPPQGLEHLKSACLHGTAVHNKLHFRGHTEQCPAIVGLLINASVSSALAQTPKSPVANTQPSAKKPEDSTSVSSTTSWTRFWWLGGGLGIAAVAAYFFFIRNK